MILLELFLTFFKIGAFTFGGGYAMLPMIEAEANARGWLSTEELIDFIAVSESTPGPYAVNIATFIGIRTGGVAGAAAATLGVVLPSFLIILLTAGLYSRFRQSKTVAGAMGGLKPAVVGLIAAALLTLLKAVFLPDGFSTALFTDPSFYVSLLIFAAGVLLSFRKVPPVAVILISAAAGIVSGFLFS